MRRKLAAGNWKMNGSLAAMAEVRALCEAHPAPTVDILLCPPATLIWPMASMRHDHPLAVGAQDCHAEAKGAHTGDISAAMLKEAGATAVIVGHSERRADHGETSQTVAAKGSAAIANGLLAVVCVGETLEEREAGHTLDVVGTQLADSLPEGANADTLVIAYEPVWAIGTGKVPTLEQIGEVHGYLRAQLADHLPGDADGIRLLYGGSVKGSNAAEIFAVADVDGALVGGASLTAEDFSPIVSALQKA
ncbi:triose-phosphate isomerase [Pelagovum pacificum]|uniref:Triosephosphate isomerase n=1 Tax=Pelagovum pacificum TaxID=2588711 RepID=A0A5C5GBW0_9RHOB|nr:triose-phosphate isomerase [Pelagovum pacificum]QQA41192.1 triose-phosphate isomerase [Pelagovum pacificum]TNY32000.1 triose-phosphate isomerase [Pelagovum pacificum]